MSNRPQKAPFNTKNCKFIAKNRQTELDYYKFECYSVKINNVYLFNFAHILPRQRLGSDAVVAYRAILFEAY